jgi:signal transduction histidine kinase
MARVNHELRTPLNAVIGFSEVMALEMFGPLGNDRYQEYVGHIRDSASEVLKSAEDTLALTALMTTSHDIELSSCTLQHVAADAWAFLSRKAAGRGIELDMCLSPDLEVLGEPRTLRQIMVNVLSEAIARAAHGERVTLMAVADGELVEVCISVPVERPRVAVADTSLAMSLARTLLEMQGTSLLEIDPGCGGWRAVTVLDRAAQPDFFPRTFGSLEFGATPALAN